MDKRFSEMTFPEQLNAYESACAEVSRLKARLEERENRLQIDPGGSDKIDELEDAVNFLRHRAETAEKQIEQWKDASGLECGGGKQMLKQPNLLEETILALRYEGLTPQDVQWCGSADGRYFFDWRQFEKLADEYYDNGFGGQEVAKDLVVVGIDWWLERGEYDGSEWWNYKKMPEPAKDGHLLPLTLFPKTKWSKLGE